MPRNSQTASANGSFAVPQKILNLSSTRARCGLRSCLSSVLIFFSAAVASVAIVLTAGSRFQLRRKQASFVAGRSSFAKAHDAGLVAFANDQRRTTYDRFSGWAARIRT